MIKKIIDYSLIRVPLSQEANAFNVAQKKTRRIVEYSLGLLKERFRCLKYPLSFNPISASRIISCCICLRNIIKKDDDTATPADEVNDNNPDDQAVAENVNR